MHDLAERAWKIYRVLSSAPSSLKPVCDATLLMTGALRLIDEDVQNADLTGTDERAFRDLKIGSNAVVVDLEDALADGRSTEGTLDAVLSTQSNILDQTRRLQSFHAVLRRYSQQRITRVLEQVLGQKSEDFEPADIRDWTVLSSKLQKLGFSATLLDEEYFFINGWLDENLPSGHDKRNIEEEEENDEELPDYTPGSQQEPIAEKIQALEQIARNMAINDTTAVPVATSSSGAEPPPYTFDESSDGIEDQEFAMYIQRAVEKEAHFLSLDHEQNPVLKHRPYSWLPTELQHDYMDRRDIIRDVDNMSFTMMAYHTAPRIRRDAGRMIDAIKISYEFKPDTPNHDTVLQAISALEFILQVSQKYNLLLHPKSTQTYLSDLDEVDFVYSTAFSSLQRGGRLPQDTGFPQQDFDLARESCYMLLTYIMGLLGLLSVVFPGQKYASRRLRDVETLWVDKRVGVRVAWVGKQLAGWEKIEDAVCVCREWYDQNHDIKERAISALMTWQNSERIFFPSNETCSFIELTVLSATGLPRPNFRTPTAWAKLSLYSEINSDGRFKGKTQMASKSQNPVWDETFHIGWQKGDKWVNIDIFDRIAGIEQHLGKARIRFSWIPGVEANFANGSLMYSYDGKPYPRVPTITRLTCMLEECEFPIKWMFTSGKGKEAAISSVMKVRLKWVGREEDVLRVNLPARPPGKMFKPDYGGIPISPEERAALRRSGRIL